MSRAVSIVIVVAVAENGVIGRGGALPWRMPSDLATFRRMTAGKPVIMGRKTFQSLGKPLKERDNIVITRNPGFRAEGVLIAADLAQALDLAHAAAAAREADEIAIIGGGEVYAAAMHVADRIYLTRIHASPAGDAMFPSLDPAVWEELEHRPIPTTERDEHAATLVVFRRRGASQRATPNTA